LQNGPPKGKTLSGKVVGGSRTILKNSGSEGIGAACVLQAPLQRKLRNEWIWIGSSSSSSLC